MSDIREDFVKALADLEEARTVELTKKRVESGEDPFRILEDVRKGRNSRQAF